VPAAVPVSAKMRLGHRDDSLLLDNARAIAAGGAAELVVHGRTKLHGYRPPAYWDRIAAVREAVAGPALRVVANGEVWTVADAQQCLHESGCDALMLGRGLVADPGLALALRGALAPGWADVAPLLPRYADLVRPRVAPRHRGGRLKQWINQLRRRFPEAQALYDEVRTLRDADTLVQVVRAMTSSPISPPMEKARVPPEHAGFV
jgi:tRNA-dihydrouridine synthase C